MWRTIRRNEHDSSAKGQAVTGNREKKNWTQMFLEVINRFPGSLIKTLDERYMKESHEKKKNMNQ